MSRNHSLDSRHCSLTESSYLSSSLSLSCILCWSPLGLACLPSHTVSVHCIPPLLHLVLHVIHLDSVEGRGVWGGDHVISMQFTFTKERGIYWQSPFLISSDVSSCLVIKECSKSIRTRGGMQCSNIQWRMRCGIIREVITTHGQPCPQPFCTQ